jgi:hypothetical protein
MKIRLHCFILALLLTIGVNAQTTILDFETEATSTTFQYFGSDLEPTLTNVVANPDPTGINTSAMVSDFMKPVGAQVWAGAFANPITMQVNVVAGNSVCMKVWFMEAGSVSLKLEGGTVPNWLTTQEVSETGTWTELCWDTNDISLEDPFDVAAGGIFDQVTLFFDFGSTPEADMTYYFDDLIVGEGTADPADITFAVDMNSYGGSYTNVFVSGTFNDWSGNANQLADDDGDGVYTATITGLEPGTYEYKYQVDEWTAQEEFGDKNYACTISDGTFTNRKLGVSTTATLATVCWQSCYACGEAVNITVNLGGAGIDVDSTGLFIAGGGNFGNPGDNPLLDEDEDDVYSMVFEKPLGFESFYTFTNGACPDYSCKENIEGQSCANPDNFNDRKMGPFMEDSTISTCFGLCSDNTNCEGGVAMVTFSVDMNPYTGEYANVYVAGTFNNWSGDANIMSDDDGDGIYTTSVEIAPSSIEYKFELDNWVVSEEFVDGDPCTITDPSGTFVNRAMDVGTDDIDVCFLWSTCDACEIAADPTVTFSVDMNGYSESFTTAYVAGDFVNWSGDALPMTDDDGDGVWTTSVQIASGPHEYKFELDNWVVSEQFEDGDPCTITDPSGAFVNRFIEVGGDDMEVCFEWETCTACTPVGVSSIEATNNLFVITPSLVQSYTTIQFNETYKGEKELILFNTLGAIIKIETIRNGTQEYLLSADDLQNGLYYLNIQTDGVQQTQKFIVNR